MNPEQEYHKEHQIWMRLYQRTHPTTWAMTQLQAAAFVLGRGTPVRLDRELSRASGIHQPRSRFYCDKDLLGIFGPVGCDMQSACGFEFVRDHLQKPDVEQATFVMALFGPGDESY
jgi:hypothetical protein